MKKCLLITNKFSYSYIRNSVKYTEEILRKYSRAGFQSHIVETVDEVIIEPDSITFIIGDPFPIFERKPDCYYVFINFSLLYQLGDPINASTKGLEWISRKRRSFMEKVHCFDEVMDFYPAQTRIMKKELSGLPVMVRSFPVNVLVDEKELLPIEKREFDVCIVGSMTNRRIDLCQRLAQQGMVLSPPTTFDISETIRHSRLVLNIHAYRCNTLEIPRVLEAMLAGTALLTEHCFEIEDTFASKYYFTAAYDELEERTQFLINNHRQLHSVSANAKLFVRNQYDKDCEMSWKELIDAVFTSACA